MPRKERFQTRLNSDDAEAVGEYQDQTGASEAEAIRRLVRAGLDAERTDEDEAATAAREAAEAARKSPDGGKVMDRFDEVNERFDNQTDRIRRQEVNQRWRFISLTASALYIAAVLSDTLGGWTAAMIGVGVLAGLVVTLYGVTDARDLTRGGGEADE
jgi:hypothetical protein